MYKIKKLVLSITMVIFVMFLSSCSGTKKLEKAFVEINEESYTVEGTMGMKVETISQGQSLGSQNVISTITIEGDSTQTYTITTTEGDSIYAYTKIEENIVKSYTKLDSDSDWEYVGAEDLSDYTDSITDILDLNIETEDVFKKEKGVWVGNPTEITKILREYLNEMADDLGGGLGTLKNAEITKYNIELDGKHLSKIDFSMTMTIAINVSGYNVEVTVNMDMIMNFSKIGETTVTVPENLPTA